MQVQFLFNNFKIRFMERKEALEILKENLKKENLIKHSIAVEAIMKGLAKFLKEDEERWGLIGLLHDIDFEKTENDFSSHGIKAKEILSGKVDEDFLRTIRSHNFENTKEEPKEKVDFALIASDAVSGLIIACALVLPSKKLEDLKVETVIKKFKQKDFARNCRRERILFCEKMGIEKEKFFEIALNSLKNVSRELGL